MADILSELINIALKKKERNEDDEAKDILRELLNTLLNQALKSEETHKGRVKSKEEEIEKAIENIAYLSQPSSLTKEEQINALVPALAYGVMSSLISPLFTTAMLSAGKGTGGAMPLALSSTIPQQRLSTGDILAQEEAKYLMPKEELRKTLQALELERFKNTLETKNLLERYYSQMIPAMQTPAVELALNLAKLGLSKEQTEMEKALGLQRLAREERGREGETTIKLLQQYNDTLRSMTTLERNYGTVKNAVYNIIQKAGDNDIVNLVALQASLQKAEKDGALEKFLNDIGSRTSITKKELDALFKEYERNYHRLYSEYKILLQTIKDLLGDIYIKAEEKVNKKSAEKLLLPEE